MSEYNFKDLIEYMSSSYIHGEWKISEIKIVGYWKMLILPGGYIEI